MNIKDMTTAALLERKQELELVLKPYPNEHSCRLNSPDKYDKFRRQNCRQKHDGKCIDVIYGIKEGKSEIQALRYSIKIWDKKDARNHCKTREGTFEPAEKEEAKAKYNCECIKCGHKLTSDKHCKDLKCPKCGRQMRRIERPGPGQESTDNRDSFDFLKDEREDIYSTDNEGVIELEENEIKGTIPFKETPKAPEGEKWDGPREVREAEVSDLKVMCTWVDSEHSDIKRGYKLPHHKAKGHAVVWRGVAAAMVALLGGRGGVNIPDSDKKGVYSHLAKTYKQFDKEPPEFREYTEEELKEVFPEVYEEPKQTEREQQITRELFDRLTEQLNKVEEELKALKEGRVLSEKNRKLVKQCADMLMVLYEATEPPKREEFELEIDDGVKSRPVVDDGDKLEIDNEKLIENIASIIKNRIGDMVQDAVNRARGEVE